MVQQLSDIRIVPERSRGRIVFDVYEVHPEYDYYESSADDYTLVSIGNSSLTIAGRRVEERHIKKGVAPDLARMQGDLMVEFAKIVVEEL